MIDHRSGQAIDVVHVDRNHSLPTLLIEPGGSRRKIGQGLLWFVNIDDRAIFVLLETHIDGHGLGMIEGRRMEWTQIEMNRLSFFERMRGRKCAVERRSDFKKICKGR